MRELTQDMCGNIPIEAFTKRLGKRNKDVLLLRPIGTRFWVHYPPDPWSTDPYSHDRLYEVVGHVKTARFLGDKDGPMGEEIKIIQIAAGISEEEK